MSRVGNTCRCPGCNKIGSPKLGGYCKNCDPVHIEKINRKKDEETPLPFNRATIYPTEFFRSEPFIPSEYGFLKKKNFNKEPTL